ncbi:MAG: hypothetical protein ABI193_24120, partial [Minicystis sp.]
MKPSRGDAGPPSAAIPPPPDSLSAASSTESTATPLPHPSPVPPRDSSERTIRRPSPRPAAPTRVALPPRLPPPPASLTPAKQRTRWEKVRRFFRPPRKLKVTREGKYYLGITLGVGFAAINTGNNLLYLLLGMLLSLMLVSGVMSDLSLRRLTVTRRLPVRAQVGRAHLVEIEVYNHKKRVPSYAIEVEDLRAGQPADKRCFFLKISPSSAQVAAYRRTPAKR